MQINSNFSGLSLPLDPPKFLCYHNMKATRMLKAAQDLTAELFGTVEELKRECEKSEVLRENSEK